MSQPRRACARQFARRSLTGWAVGFGCSVLADQVFFLGLAWAAVQLEVAGLVGLVLAAGSVPRLLVLLLGGALADAKSPKRIIIGTDSGRAVILAGAAVLVLLGSLDAWALVAVAVAVGTLDGFFLPAVAALPVRIAPPHLVGRVAALRTITQRVGMLAGGPLAGWLIYLFGPSGAFFGSAVLFALSVSCLALVTVAPAALSTATPVPPASSPRLLARLGSDSIDAFRFIRRTPVLAGLLLLIAGMNFGFAGPFTAGIPLLAAANGWGARGAGLLIGSFGIGAALSGLSLLLRKRIPRAGWVQLAAVVSMAAATAAVGMGPTLPIALTAALALGLSSGVFGTVVYGLLLELTPAAETGRVMGLLSLTLEGSAALSFLATGTAAGASGAGAAFLGGGLVILATALAVGGRPSLRRLELGSSPTAVPDPAGTEVAYPGPLTSQSGNA